MNGSSAIASQLNAPSSNVSSGFQFDDMSAALDAFRAGEFLVVMDDEGRENEGDLIIAADSITTEKMAWFIRVTRYVLCSLLFAFVNEFPPVSEHSKPCL